MVPANVTVSTPCAPVKVTAAAPVLVLLRVRLAASEPALIVRSVPLRAAVITRLWSPEIFKVVMLESSLATVEAATDVETLRVSIPPFAADVLPIVIVPTPAL